MLHFDPGSTEQEVEESAARVLLDEGDHDAVAELDLKVRISAEGFNV